MISPAAFVQTLQKNGISHFTGVPCSFFQAAINYVIARPDLRYTIAPNEGSALALAAGASMAGAPTAVLIQNSGFGNLVNPLTSLNMIYRIPALLFISGRAYGVPDEPQHEIIGKTMKPILEALGVRHEDMPDSEKTFETALEKACAHMRETGQPFAFFVRKGTIDEFVPEKTGKTSYPLKRIDAIRIISESLGGDEAVIATTGKPSRELFSVADRRGNFYMQGSMGHAASIGLGVALAKPQKKVVVLDGDGAILMHMGVLSSVGHYQPKNFFHIVLDNESYETTGDQDTTSPTTDLKTIARASGYRFSDECSDEKDLREKIKRMLASEGPSFLRVKINRLPTGGVPRISDKYTSTDIHSHFRSALAGGGA